MSTQGKGALQFKCIWRNEEKEVFVKSLDVILIVTEREY